MQIILILLLLIIPAEAQAPKSRPKPVIEYINREYIVTAYTPDIAENGGFTTDYKGRPLKAGIIACDDLPDGTKVMIGDKTYIVQDIFGGGYKGRIDILMLTKEEAFRWGRRKMIVQIIKEDK